MAASSDSSKPKLKEIVDRLPDFVKDRLPKAISKNLDRDIDAPLDKEGNTALHLALTDGVDFELANALLNAGANVNKKNESGNPAFFSMDLFDNYVRVEVEKRAAQLPPGKFNFFQKLLLNADLTIVGNIGAAPVPGTLLDGIILHHIFHERMRSFFKGEEYNDPGPCITLPAPDLFQRGMVSFRKICNTGWHGVDHFALPPSLFSALAETLYRNAVKPYKMADIKMKRLDVSGDFVTVPGLRSLKRSPLLQKIVSKSIEQMKDYNYKDIYESMQKCTTTPNDYTEKFWANIFKYGEILDKERVYHMNLSQEKEAKAKAEVLAPPILTAKDTHPKKDKPSPKSDSDKGLGLGGQGSDLNKKKPK